MGVFTTKIDKRGLWQSTDSHAAQWTRIRSWCFDIFTRWSSLPSRICQRISKRGTTTVGLKYKDGVILIVDKRIANKLVITDSIEKMYQIDDHIGMTTSGLVADARQLVDKARIQCQINRMTYGSPISMITLVKKMCDYKQSFTQYGGARPFGTALLIAGVDQEGSHLFETDPSEHTNPIMQESHREGEDLL